MATLNIEGRSVDVDDGFLKLTPIEQNSAVEEIAGSMKLAPAALPGQSSATAEPSGSGVLMNATAGLNSGIYNTLGAPVDAATWAVNKGIQGINALTGAGLPEARNDLPGSSRSLAGGFNAVGVAKPEDVVAASPEERIARGLGEGVGYTVAPQAAVGGLARAGVGALAPRTMDALATLTGQTASTGRTVGNAIAGGTAGAGSAAAIEDAPEAWKPLAALGGGLAGGALGTAVASVPSLAMSGGRIAGEFLDPLTAAGRERSAGRELREAATDPSAARQALESAPEELVPGSRPTTFQASGDLGLGGLERRVQTENPEAFAARRAEQNTARLDAFDQIQPGGHPEAISKAFRDRLASIDSETESTLTQATEGARGRAQGLGGNLPPETYGDALRGSLANSESAARQQTSALWKAIDPENRMNIPTSNSSATAKQVLADMTEYAQPMEGAESSIFNMAAKMPGEVRVRMLGDLRGYVSSAMRQEMSSNGASPAHARLSRLRTALEDDIDGVVRQRAAADEQAVSAGTMAPEDTLLAKWSSGMQSAAEAWRADRTGQARSQAVGDSRGLLAGGSRGVSAAPRAQGPVGGRFDDAAGNPRGAENDAGLTFDDAARERLKAATAAIRERHQTFGTGTNAQILARSGQSGPYKLASASVPGRLFFPGNGSGQRIAEFRQAAGDEQALGVLQDYAASQLRKTVERADGTLDPARLESWRRAHADALRAFPDLDARFRDAGQASQTMAEAAASRRQRLDDYQKGIVGRLIDAREPADVTKMVGGIFSRQDAAGTMGSLAAQVRSDPSARQGLRKAVADYIAGRFVGNMEAGTTGQGTLKSDGFQTFIVQNQPALKHVFSGDELATLTRIAVDIQRSNRSLYATKIPGQSNTAQDITRLKKDDGFGSIMGRMLAASAAGATSAGGIGWTIGGPIGAAVGVIGGAGAAALRQNGVRKVEDLVRDAMLDPKLAQTLMQRTPAKNAEGIGELIANRYRNAALAGEMASADEEPPTDPNITISRPASAYLQRGAAER